MQKSYCQGGDNYSFHILTHDWTLPPHFEPLIRSVTSELMHTRCAVFVFRSWGRANQSHLTDPRIGYCSQRAGHTIELNGTLASRYTLWYLPHVTLHHLVLTTCLICVHCILQPRLIPMIITALVLVLCTAVVFASTGPQPSLQALNERLRVNNYIKFIALPHFTVRYTLCASWMRQCSIKIREASSVTVGIHFRR